MDLRALNRSLLARQGLLERSREPVPRALERLVGVQAQEPFDPYVALWSRLEDFDPLELSGMLERGEAVRAGLMRATIHLVTAADYDALQPVMADRMRRTFRSTAFSRSLGEEDLDAIVAAGRGLLGEAPRTRAELAASLAPTFPTAAADAIGHAVTYHLPLVQAPPRALWGRSGRAQWALREPAGDGAPVADIVRRYLAVFGPASPADVRTWCGLTGLREVIDTLDLRDVGGGLLDLPDMPWPDPDTPAPPRFLPEYDNVWLSHADRSRIIGTPTRLLRGRWRGFLLVDGFLAAAWALADGVLVVEGDVPHASRDAVVAEAEALLAFITPGTEPRVRLP